MIPAFPEFKKISTDDREAVESYTRRYQPYSDFNFTNLWAWDTSGERMISELKGNFVVRFTDYKTCEHLLSFLGSNESESTARQLLHFAEASGVSPILRFITEESMQNLQNSNLYVEEDQDNFDYIFSVSELVALQGSKFKGKRHLAEGFLREYPDVLFESRELSDVFVQEQIISVLRRWEDKKKLDNKTYDLGHEKKALSRLLETANKHKLILSCIFLHDAMIGFSIDEIVPHQYAISHFFKADNSFKGISEFLNEKVAQYLVVHDVVLWNWQQDLGIEDLRRSKMSYRPVNFLKKYRVSFGPQKIKHGEEKNAIEHTSVV